jgi:hypothetical protein
MHLDCPPEKSGISSRPVSTNPFLDDAAPLSPVLPADGAMSPKKSSVVDREVTEQAAEIFVRNFYSPSSIVHGHSVSLVQYVRYQ